MVATDTGICRSVAVHCETIENESVQNKCSLARCLGLILQEIGEQTTASVLSSAAKRSGPTHDSSKPAPDSNAYFNFSFKVLAR